MRIGICEHGRTDGTKSRKAAPGGTKTRRALRRSQLEFGIGASFLKTYISTQSPEFFLLLVRKDAELTLHRRDVDRQNLTHELKARGR